MNAVRLMLCYSVLGFFLGMVCAPAWAAPPQKGKLFREGVLPILRENCLGCHGAGRVSGLDMRTASGLRKGGTHGAVIVPGNPNQSRLFRYVSGRASLQMPPGKRLTPQEIAVLREWIAAGATWPSGVTVSDPLPWAFRKPVRSSLPKVKSTGWARNPIDVFVLAKLEARGLKPAPPADRITLLRRVTFDLTGLPPTPAEVDTFLHDKSPNAYEK